MSEETTPRRGVWLYLPPRSLALIGGAFVVGLALFAALWLSNRDKTFYRADGQVAAQDQAPIAPLPAPLAAGQGASEMPAARPAADPGERPHLVQTPAPEPLQEPIAPDAALATTEPAAPPPSTSSDTPPQRIAQYSPAPEYPASALRANVRGTVVLDVDVDASGRPTAVRIAQRSGSRALDRAALRAVQGWRFQPAMAGGQPVPGLVQIPIEFNP